MLGSAFPNHHALCEVHTVMYIAFHPEIAHGERPQLLQAGHGCFNRGRPHFMPKVWHIILSYTRLESSFPFPHSKCPRCPHDLSSVSTDFMTFTLFIHSHPASSSPTPQVCGISASRRESQRFPASASYSPADAVPATSSSQIEATR